MWSSVSSSQRILSLWLERLSTDRIARQSREITSPLAVFGKRGNLDMLVAVDAAAEEAGLRTGLALAQARAMHPALVAMPEDRLPMHACSTSSPTGASATRRSSPLIPPTASCSISAAARISSAARKNYATSSSHA